MHADFLIKGREIFLTPTERKLLDLLKSDNSKYFTTLEIERKVWGKPQRHNVVAVYVSHLRSKLGKKTIIRRPGYGYLVQGI